MKRVHGLHDAGAGDVGQAGQFSVVGDLHTLGPSLTPPRTGIYTA
jgi:hypothetical protein